jgi:hypothetical protein
MKQCKLLVQRHRSGAVVVALALLILGLAFFAAPATSSAQDAPNGTIPGGTVPPMPPLRPSITFVHAAPFDADVNMTGVDVCTDEDEIVPGLDDIVYGEARTLFFDPDWFDWKIAVPGTNCLNVLVDIEPFSLGYNAVKVLVFSGDGVNQPLDVIDVLAREGGGVIFMPVLARFSSLG